MARRPARLERAGALTPRDRIWSAIRALKHTTATGSLFSGAEIAWLSEQRVDTVASYLRALTNAGYVELIEHDRPEGRPMRALFQFRLVRDVGVNAPRLTAEGKPVTAGQANERMWIAMKAMREFDPAELASAATLPDAPVSIETANTYCKHLCRAGYVALAVAARTGRSMARYRFIRARNTGDRAPLVCRDKSVMDANTGETVYTPGGRA